MDFITIMAKILTRIRTAVMNPFRVIIRKISMLTNINVILAKTVAPITKKVREILSFKAKSPEDYLVIGNFWISKKIIALFILTGCVSVFLYFEYMADPVPDTVEVTGVLTTTYYDYDDLDLEEFSGKANIRAANGEVVYTGDINNGICSGTGTLWNQDGTKIYEGTFENNKFEGTGIYYYANGKPQYVGEFSDNTFNGEGSFYYTSGIVAYEGAFEKGNFHGAGVAYNEMGNMIYEGTFQNGIYHGDGILYYDNGIKKYEGEYYMGLEQGTGTMYSQMGKRLFTGQFARGGIYYESLFGYGLDELSTMFGEDPTIYYTTDAVCYLYSGAQVAVKLDCTITSKIEESAVSEGDGWYVPSDGEELEEIPEDTEIVEFETGDDEVEQVSLPIMSTSDKYTLYYYLVSNEWQKEADMDISKIGVTQVIAFTEDINLDLLKDLEPVSSASGATLSECVAIDNLRIDVPTIFSSISFQQKAQNQNYYYVSGIQQTESIYTEIYDVENIRYKMCFETEDPLNMKFLILEQY